LGILLYICKQKRTTGGTNELQTNDLGDRALWAEGGADTNCELRIVEIEFLKNVL